jgi:hypothetical protein
MKKPPPQTKTTQILRTMSAPSISPRTRKPGRRRHLNPHRWGTFAKDPSDERQTPALAKSEHSQKANGEDPWLCA